MEDIIGRFPTAEQVKEYGALGFHDYLFEKELNGIFEKIAECAGYDGIVMNYDISEEAIEFLKEKGYTITEDFAGGVAIAWQEGINYYNYRLEPAPVYFGSVDYV